MKLVVFGLTITSSWGNGHATLWRGLVRALGARGHHVVFFERDVPYYAVHRDLTAIPRSRDPALRLVATTSATRPRVTCATRMSPWSRRTAPTRRTRAQLVLGSAAAVRAFYDLDTPVTLSRLDAGARGRLPAAAGARRLRPGAQLHRRRRADGASRPSGRAVRAAALRIGRSRGAPPDRARGPRSKPTCRTSGPTRRIARLRSTALFLEPARQRPDLRFVIGGSMYPESFTWTPEHLLREPRAAAGSSRVLQFLAAHAERHARGDGRDGALPVGTAVRGGGVRRADPDGPVGRSRRVLRTGARDLRRGRRPSRRSPHWPATTRTAGASPRPLASGRSTVTRRSGACSIWSERSRRRVRRSECT